MIWTYRHVSQQHYVRSTISCIAKNLTHFLEIDDAEEDWNLVRDMEEEVDEEVLGHLGDGLTTAAER